MKPYYYDEDNDVEYFPVTYLAEKYHCSQKTIYSWDSQGLLNTMNKGIMLVAEDDNFLLAFARKGKEQPKAVPKISTRRQFERREKKSEYPSWAFDPHDTTDYTGKKTDIIFYYNLYSRIRTTKSRD